MNVEVDYPFRILRARAQDVYRMKSLKEVLETYHHQQESLRGKSTFKRQCICEQSHYEQEGTDNEPKRTLSVEYWERTDECLERKWAHMEMVDELFESREGLILATTLNNEETVLEPNMFPYDTPEGIEHWTLWSRYELDDADVEEFVCGWLKENAPQVISWNYDENLSRSINVFHVHVYLQVPVELGNSNKQGSYGKATSTGIYKSR